MMDTELGEVMGSLVDFCEQPYNDDDCDQKLWDRHSTDTTEDSERLVADFMRYWRTHA